MSGVVRRAARRRIISRAGLRQRAVSHGAWGGGGLVGGGAGGQDDRADSNVQEGEQGRPVVPRVASNRPNRPIPRRTGLTRPRPPPPPPPSRTRALTRTNPHPN